MTYAEAQRQYQATLEAVRAAWPNVPVYADADAWNEDALLIELKAAERARNVAWLEHTTR